MNKVQLTGRLTADPELRYTESNKAYTRFSLAVGRNFKNKDGEYDADFFNIVAWEKRAESSYTTATTVDTKKGTDWSGKGRVKRIRSDMYEQQQRQKQ